MRALMMDTPLLISSQLTHAARVFADQEIVSRTVAGPIHRYTYAAAHRRSCQLANALTDYGIAPSDRIGTVAWNGFRHLEIYFAVSGMGAVCHTMNPRLSPEQLIYIINHAGDRLLFVDTTFLPLVEAVIAQLTSLETVVVMIGADDMPTTTLPHVLCYEDFIAGQPDQYAWPVFDENTASSLCYTSGTTGHPKGVLYSHRSTVLHSFAAALPDAMHMGEYECVMPVVPMFHVNAWGILYAAAMTGTKLVMPGPKLDGASLHELIIAEHVTMTAGVPTLWLGLLGHVKETGQDLGKLQRTIIGGSAVPAAMIATFENDYGVDVRHAWGMTEMSPLGTLNRLKPSMHDAPEAERMAIKTKQGRAVFGVEMEIRDPAGSVLPCDGVAFGELFARGPWIASGYFGDDDGPALAWFPTGDIATIDTDGYVLITDRAKDLIKSGGEWIGSLELENLATNHPHVHQAAVIGIPHPKWDERPLLLVVAKPNTDPSKQAILDEIAGHVPSFWLPDDVLFVDALPLGATGKVLKTKLREQYRDHQLPGADESAS